jgi:crotonobetainyl-CoA:carnitine CoA-transferase CaiB-like acyl-CoA transferase
LGEHTAEIMTELGFSAEQIGEVLAANPAAVPAAISAIFD